ncbi:hypothetical protein NA57DRAFT_76320 [Rhizodiscina lignyota]|uniref:Uncharacterized protein n=1 Tax=Rhizodiscina lignyota TaxID=1504668 RepID=A0A9P4M6P2_9PEZI|nr:hypothetical protein NA57DRAFT_76320 [Rhizodiscina lignyota]
MDSNIRGDTYIAGPDDFPTPDKIRNIILGYRGQFEESERSIKTILEVLQLRPAAIDLDINPLLASRALYDLLGAIDKARPFLNQTLASEPTSYNNSLQQFAIDSDIPIAKKKHMTTLLNYNHAMHQRRMIQVRFEDKLRSVLTSVVTALQPYLEQVQSGRQDCSEHQVSAYCGATEAKQLEIIHELGKSLVVLQQPDGDPSPMERSVFAVGLRRIMRLRMWDLDEIFLKNRAELDDCLVALNQLSPPAQAAGTEVE